MQAREHNVTVPPLPTVISEMCITKHWAGNQEALQRCRTVCADAQGAANPAAEEASSGGEMAPAAAADDAAPAPEAGAAPSSHFFSSSFWDWHQVLHLQNICHQNLHYTETPTIPESFMLQLQGRTEYFTEYFTVSYLNQLRISLLQASQRRSGAPNRVAKRLVNWAGLGGDGSAASASASSAGEPLAQLAGNGGGGSGGYAAKERDVAASGNGGSEPLSSRSADSAGTTPRPEPAPSGQTQTSVPVPAAAGSRWRRRSMEGTPTGTSPTTCANTPAGGPGFSQGFDLLQLLSVAHELPTHKLPGAMFRSSLHLCLYVLLLCMRSVNVLERAVSLTAICLASPAAESRHKMHFDQYDDHSAQGC